jgi:hypothetical protein
MQLHAKRPAGRSDRKAGAYASEILRMRDEGYTYPAILEALKDVGVTTTHASVRREVRRLRTHSNASNDSSRPQQIATPMPPATSDAMARKLARPMTTGARGREVAEAFFNAHPSNPLFRSEDSA